MQKALIFAGLLAVNLLALALGACQPVNDGTAGARIFAECDMGRVTAGNATTGHVMAACVNVNTSGATSSVPTTTTTPTTTVTVPVSAVPSLP
jgi:hypothetical protein